MSAFRVRFSGPAREDLERLFDFLLERATSVEDLSLAKRAIDAVQGAVAGLARSPFSYRKAGASPLRRELIVPFGHSGYVVLFEILDAAEVLVLAVRHQREDDYH